MEYVNFFENQKEAQMRLQGTVVLYDGEPVEIFAVTDHVKDGHLRAYIRPIGASFEEQSARPQPTGINNYPPGHDGAGTYLDEFIAKNPSCGLIRKHLSSPKFNKFRPFELGMYWDPPYVYYVERQPNRKTEQGLIPSMCVSKQLTPSHMDGASPNNPLDLYGPEMRRCILGEHPTPSRCLDGLISNKYANTAAAFHRHFALVKGPVDTMFLAYKSRVIGVLPHADFSKVRIGEDFKYCKEVVQDLHLFNDVTM